MSAIKETQFKRVSNTTAWSGTDHSAESGIKSSLSTGERIRKKAKKAEDAVKRGANAMKRSIRSLSARPHSSLGRAGLDRGSHSVLVDHSSPKSRSKDKQSVHESNESDDTFGSSGTSSGGPSPLSSPETGTHIMESSTAISEEFDLSHCPLNLRHSQESRRNAAGYSSLSSASGSDHRPAEISDSGTKVGVMYDFGSQPDSSKVNPNKDEELDAELSRIPEYIRYEETVKERVIAVETQANRHFGDHESGLPQDGTIQDGRLIDEEETSQGNNCSSGFQTLNDSPGDSRNPPSRSQQLPLSNGSRGHGASGERGHGGGAGRGHGLGRGRGIGRRRGRGNGRGVGNLNERSCESWPCPWPDCNHEPEKNRIKEHIRECHLPQYLCPRHGEPHNCRYIQGRSYLMKRHIRTYHPEVDPEEEWPEQRQCILLHHRYYALEKKNLSHQSLWTICNSTSVDEICGIPELAHHYWGNWSQPASPQIQPTMSEIRSPQAPSHEVQPQPHLPSPPVLPSTSENPDVATIQAIPVAPDDAVESIVLDELDRRLIYDLAWIIDRIVYQRFQAWPGNAQLNQHLASERLKVYFPKSLDLLAEWYLQNRSRFPPSSPHSYMSPNNEVNRNDFSSTETPFLTSGPTVPSEMSQSVSNADKPASIIPATKGKQSALLHRQELDIPPPSPSAPSVLQIEDFKGMGDWHEAWPRRPDDVM